MLILLFFRLFLLLKKTTLRKQILYKLLILYYRKNTLFIIFPYSLPVFYIHSSKKKICFHLPVFCAVAVLNFNVFDLPKATEVQSKTSDWFSLDGFSGFSLFAGAKIWKALFRTDCSFGLGRVRTESVAAQMNGIFAGPGRCCRIFRILFIPSTHT